jgi:hypothetical protein
MTEPRETEPHPEDYEDPEDFAEAVGVDPTPQQVDEYREETEANRREPSDPTGGSGA